MRLRESDEGTARRMKKKDVVTRAGDMAMSLLKRLRDGGMMDAFRRAGMHFESQEKRRVYEQLEELQVATIMDPTNEEKSPGL